MSVHKLGILSVASCVCIGVIVGILFPDQPHSAVLTLCFGTLWLSLLHVIDGRVW